MSSQDRTEALDPATLAQLAAAARPLARAGWAIGDYELVEEIGRGSMGLVFRARHSGFDHDVALKVLPATMALDEAARVRFLTEARAMARVVHPNVVRVHNVVEADGTLAIVMERVEGLTLAALLRALRATDRAPDLGFVRQELGAEMLDWEATTYPDWVAQIGAEIADALQAVHVAGLTHRDVKPSNILIDHHGHAHLADFGVVRDAEATRTLAQGFVGTMVYASPEQLRGDGQIGTPADVFGLGATLYELLTLAPPAEGQLATVLETVERGRIPLLDGRTSLPLPPHLGHVIHHALQPEPDRRYPTAAAFAADLRNVRGQRPISIRKPGLAERALLWARREPARARAAAALLVTAAILLAVGGYLFAQLPRIRMARDFELSRRVDDLIGAGRILTTLRARPDAADGPLRQALELAPGNPIAIGVLAIHRASSSGPAAARELLAEHAEAAARSPALRRLEETGVELYSRPPETAAAFESGNCDPLDCFLAGIAAAMRAREHNTVADQRQSMRIAVDLLELAVLNSDPVPWIYRLELAGAAADAGSESLALDQLRVLDARRGASDNSSSIELRAVMILETLGRHEEALLRCKRSAFQAAPLAPRVTLHARVLENLGRSDEAIDLLTPHGDSDLFVFEALARLVHARDPESGGELFGEVADRVERAIPAARARGEQIGMMLEAVHDNRTKAGLEDDSFDARLEETVTASPRDWHARTILATRLAQRANRLYYSLWHNLPTFLTRFPDAAPEKLASMLTRVPIRQELEQIRMRLGPLFDELTQVVPFHPQVARNAALWSSFGTPGEIETALERFARYAAVTPSPNAIPGGLGRLLYRAGRFEEAAAELEDKDSFRDRVLYGWALLEIGEPRRALTAFAQTEGDSGPGPEPSPLDAIWERNAMLGRALATMRAGLRNADAALIDEAEGLVRAVREPGLFGLDALVLAEAAWIAGDRATAAQRFETGERGRALARGLLPYGDQFDVSLIAAHNTVFDQLADALDR
jgi:tRNA A-37 threonylcarbamoyl transferase component Bud32/tetratricopeptide (TPR) repeat protein